ncbi:MAG: transposase [Ferruginibacter sp.]|nr:transposase [Ferruginibacter sp.]
MCINGKGYWDNIVPQYDKLFSSAEGRPTISGRVILGALMIKHIGALSDRATVLHIQETMFMQYFLGCTNFTKEEPFSDTLFVDIRKRLSLELLSKINDVIALHCLQQNVQPKEQPPTKSDDGMPASSALQNGSQSSNENTTTASEQKITVPAPAITHSGKLLMDGTVAPQNITYPADLNLLNAARVKSGEMKDWLYKPLLHGDTMPRTYRDIARKLFLNTAKKKQKSAKVIYKFNRQQLRFLRRNLAHIESRLAAYEVFPLKPKEQKYLMVLHAVYHQQHQMHRTHTKRIDDRIVSIHEPYVRPIVRGKEKLK